MLVTVPTLMLQLLLETIKEIKYLVAEEGIEPPTLNSTQLVRIGKQFSTYMYLLQLPRENPCR